MIRLKRGLIFAPVIVAILTGVQFARLPLAIAQVDCNANPDDPSCQQSIAPGQNWTGICNTIQPILVEKCSQLVNPDGTLTVPDGKKAYTCISNGIVIGLAGFLALGGDINTLLPIIGALKFLAGQTGCDGVVNWDKLDLSQLTYLRHLFHV